MRFEKLVLLFSLSALLFSRGLLLVFSWRVSTSVTCPQFLRIQFLLRHCLFDFEFGPSALVFRIRQAEELSHTLHIVFRALLFLLLLFELDILGIHYFILVLIN